MALRILLFINQHIQDISTPPVWNHGLVVSSRQQLINNFSAEPGRNGDVYSDWVTAGSLEEWYWFQPGSATHPRPSQRFYPGGSIEASTVTSIIEETDYILTSLWVPELEGGTGDWGMVALLTDGVIPQSRLDGYDPYVNPDDWE